MKKILISFILLCLTSPSLAEENIRLLFSGEESQSANVPGLEAWVENNFVIFEEQAEESGYLGTFYSDEADVSVQWVPSNQLVETAKKLFSSDGGIEGANVGDCDLKNTRNGLALAFALGAKTKSERRPKLNLIIGRCP